MKRWLPASHVPSRRPFWLAVGICVLFTGWILSRPPPGMAVVVSDVSQTLAAFLAAGASIYASRRAKARSNRRAWILFASGWFAWGVGQTTWSWYELVSDRETPFPSWADPGFLMMYPLVLVALKTLPSSRQPRLKLDGLLDSSLIVGSIVALGVATLLLPLFKSKASSASTLELILVIAYPTFALTLVSGALVAWYRGSLGRDDGSLTLLPALIWFAAGDLLFTQAELNSGFVTGALADAGWFGGMILAAGTALSMRFNVEGKEVKGAGDPGTVLVANATLLVALGTFVWLALHGEMAIGAWLSASLGTLGIGRYVALSNDYKRTLRLLAETMASREADRLELQATLDRLSESERLRSGLIQQLMNSEEDKRAAIAAYLHDEPLQNLTGMLIHLGSLQESLRESDPEASAALSSLERLIQDQIGRFSAVMWELRPPVLDEKGLEPALEDLIRRQPLSASWNIRLGELAPEMKTLVYRVAEESLRNVVQHARASTVRLEVIESDGQLVLTTTDDGEGFKMTDVGTRMRSKRFGLAVLYERISLAGGTIEIRSAPGEGTVLRVSIPLTGGQVVGAEPRRPVHL